MDEARRQRGTKATRQQGREASGRQARSIGKRHARQTQEKAGLAEAPEDTSLAETPEAPAITLELPVRPVDPLRYSPDDYQDRCRHVEVQLKGDQVWAMRSLRNGLRENAARLASGNYVQTMSDVVRWLLEGVAQRMKTENEEAPSGPSGDVE